jgi:hypothetical protein
MEADFAFRCSENETVEDAAGKTIAVERYKGVSKKETTMAITVASAVKPIMNLRFNHTNCIKSFLFSDKSGEDCDIN